VEGKGENLFHRAEMKSDGCGYREKWSIIEHSEINQLDIGQEVREWTENYNVTQVLQIGVCIRLHSSSFSSSWDTSV